MRAKHPVGELVGRSADQQNAVVMVSSLLAYPISIERPKSLDHSLAQNSDGGFDPVLCLVPVSDRRKLLADVSEAFKRVQAAPYGFG
jgi:hypothetical protein